MLSKVFNNIYKKQVPLPNNPLREINAYIIVGEKNLLIDTGFNRSECKEALENAFDELKINSADLLITHLHADHSGLMHHFSNNQNKIYTSEIDGELMNFATGNFYWYMLDELFIRYGFPRAEFGNNTDIHPGRKYCNNKPIDFTYLKDGDILNYGGYDLEVILTPGHTPSHACLYCRKNKILFCGDHILGTITPNICIELGSENPLQEYLNSLEKIEKLEINLLLPSHGTPIENPHKRIEELKEHHKKRLDEVLSILDNSWKTSHDIAKEMSWEIRYKKWEDFPVPQKWFATGEAISHLQYLFFNGKIKRKDHDGIYFYSKH